MRPRGVASLRISPISASLSVKSKIERLTENMSIFDFELSDAEMDEIRKLATPRGRIVEWGGAPEWDE